MLAYQLMLTVKRGLPLSRLLLQKTNTKTSLKLQEESASPHLKGEKVEVKEENVMEVIQTAEYLQVEALSQYCQQVGKELEFEF